MTTTRRLAAILAADVVGYSRVMAVDEVRTLEALKACRKEIVDPSISAHKGRIVKTTGDGMLVEFASAVDAVTCAVAIQESMAMRVGSLTFRIGINVGDIIIDGGDIFGDGVNVAARVENECQAGGVCVSANAFEQVRNKTPYAFDDLGERSLKNIDRPIRIYGVRIASGKSASVVLPEHGKPLPLPDKPSIAVLPFQNMSGDPEQEYFADGMVEDIITALSRKKGLFVIARNSSFTYKGKAVDIKQVGRELGVRYVLEGSIRRAASKVRITGQLIDALTGAHIWAERFDGGIDDVFDLQDRITVSVVTAIAPEIERAEIERSNRKPTESLSAYDLLLRGISATHKIPVTRPDALDARDFFQRSVKVDPSFAAAWAYLAGSHSRLYANNWHYDEENFKNTAVDLARHALSLDRNDPCILGRCGWVIAHIGKLPNEALPLLEAAVEIDPNYAMAWVWNGAVNGHIGNHSTAVDRISHAMRLSPRDALRNVMLVTRANSLFYMGRYSEIQPIAEEVIRIEPNQTNIHSVAAASLALLGNKAAAHDAMDALLAAQPQTTIALVLNNTSYRRAEDTARLVEGLRLAGMPE